MATMYTASSSCIKHWNVCSTLVLASPCWVEECGSRVYLRYGQTDRLPASWWWFSSGNTHCDLCEAVKRDTCTAWMTDIALYTDIGTDRQTDGESGRGVGKKRVSGSVIMIVFLGGGWGGVRVSTCVLLKKPLKWRNGV